MCVQVKNVRVDFPAGLSCDVGELSSQDAWRWWEARVVGSEEGGEEGEWGVERVEVETAAFQADTRKLEGEQDRPHWSFTVRGCTVAHHQDGGRRRRSSASSSGGKGGAVYCTVQRFATRQDGQVSASTNRSSAHTLHPNVGQKGGRALAIKGACLTVERPCMQCR